jgi:two-component system, chemotaxis family, response regulator Rcp1
MQFEPSSLTVNILLVEDNPGDVRLTETAFQEFSPDSVIHVAHDGVEALEFLRKEGQFETAPTPNLILLDVNLPRKNGHEVLQEVKEHKQFRKIPVIMLTTSASHHDIRRAYDLHANCYLTKPVDLEDFLSMIEIFSQYWISVASLPPRS